eukprot:8118056-Pyramimonas_sp.AAC.1
MKDTGAHSKQMKLRINHPSRSFCASTKCDAPIVLYTTNCTGPVRTVVTRLMLPGKGSGASVFDELHETGSSLEYRPVNEITRSERRHANLRYRATSDTQPHKWTCRGCRRVDWLDVRHARGP